MDYDIYLVERFLAIFLVHDTVKMTEADVFKFQSICTLTTKATDDSKQFQCSNIVFCNKLKPLIICGLTCEAFLIEFLK